jgi:hypothetical protein
MLYTENMKISYKIAAFFVLSSLIFVLLRTQGQYLGYNVETLIENLGGLTYLYSTIGIIFAIFSAFVILSESERWNNLVDITKAEVNGLRELWLWSKHFPKKIRDDFRDSIKKYLENIIEGGWNEGEGVTKDLETEQILDTLHESIYQLSKENPELMTEVFKSFTELLKCREVRISHISFHLPQILKNTLLFSNVLLVVFSFFIGVKDVWLDYIFVISIANLGYLIDLLVDDMDNPTRPGGWHLTTKDYEELLEKIS